MARTIASPQSYRQVAETATKGIVEIAQGYGRNAPASDVFRFGTVALLVIIVLIVVAAVGLLPYEQLRMIVLAVLCLAVFTFGFHMGNRWLDSKLALPAERVALEAHNRTYMVGMKHEPAS